ncbi:Cof-type HAD-IIB family hydrolase [Paenibacillus thalictri]|uniref:HAD family phosphatase n=1 Tax=Paenibacillus thalictri TaxID=2527873 RepID=A0A4Q9DMN4_9BACL|nr:HAD family hydrolase [Paenibacillus thalictri]TBL75067.1 HAD family phosphatase [Paenibacillus thalictri]
MIKLIISDLDGTLLSEHKSVEAAEIEAIHKAKREQVHFSLASGRMHSEIAAVFQEIGMTGHIVSQNGAFIQTASGQALRSAYFEPAYVHGLMEAGSGFDVLSVICAFDRYMTPSWSPVAEKISRRMFSPLNLQPDALERLGLDLHCSKISYFGPMQELLRLQALIKSTYGSKVDTFISDSDCLDAMPSGISKGSGLAILLDALGLQREETACIGDSFNDVSMFAEVGHSFAMAGSHPDVMRQAKYSVSRVAEAVEWVRQYNKNQ